MYNRADFNRLYDFMQYPLNNRLFNRNRNRSKIIFFNHNRNRNREKKKP